MWQGVGEGKYFGKIGGVKILLHRGWRENSEFRIVKSELFGRKMDGINADFQGVTNSGKMDRGDSQISADY